MKIVFCVEDIVIALAHYLKNGLESILESIAILRSSSRGEAPATRWVIEAQPLIPTINALTLKQTSNSGKFPNCMIPSGSEVRRYCKTSPSKIFSKTSALPFSPGDGNFQTSFSLSRWVADGGRADETLGEMQKYKLTHVRISSPIWLLVFTQIGDRQIWPIGTSIATIFQQNSFNIRNLFCVR